MYWELTFPTGNPKCLSNNTVSIGLPIRRIFGDMLQFKLFICINLVLSGLNSTLYSMPYWVHISNICFMAVTVGARSMTSSAYPMAPQKMLPMWQPYPEFWSLHLPMIIYNAAICEKVDKCENNSTLNVKINAICETITLNVKKIRLSKLIKHVDSKCVKIDAICANFILTLFVKI